MFKKVISLLTAVSMMAGMAVLPINAEEAEPAAVQYADENYLYGSEGLNKEEQERAEQLAAWGLAESSERPARGPKPADGEVKLMSESEYSEVVYISTVEELLAIEGHFGGYYELKNDLDLTGMEWSTLYINNATFNGGGHTITGMSITKEPGTRHIKTQWGDEDDGTVHENEREVEIHDIGFFSGYDNYVYDINLSGAKIDVTLTDMEYGNISIIGEAYADNCKVYGSINVIGGENSYNDVYGLNSGNDCEAEVSITAENRGCVHGIFDCSNSVFVGDITSSDHVYGILYSNNSTFEGDITADAWVDGIANSDNSTFTGDITADAWVDGIANSDNSTFTGDITSSDHVYGISNSNNGTFEGDITSDDGVIGISSSDNSTFKGDITADGYKNVWGISNSNNSTFEGDITSYLVYVIEDSNNSVFKGNVSAVSRACGISESNNCVFDGSINTIGSIDSYSYGIGSSRNSTFIGDITSVEPDGIYDSENCFIFGNVITTNGAANEGYCTGISDSVKCFIFGNVTANNDYAHGIRRSTDCGISGTITEYTGRG